MVSKEHARKMALRKAYEEKKKNAAHAADVTNPATGSKGLLQGQQLPVVTATGTATNPSSASSPHMQIDHHDMPTSSTAENSGPSAQVSSPSFLRSGQDFNASISSVLGTINLNDSGGSIAQRKRRNPEAEMFPTSKFARSDARTLDDELMDFDISIEPVAPPPGFDSVPPGFAPKNRGGRPPKKARGPGRPRKSADGRESRSSSVSSIWSNESNETNEHAEAILRAEEQREEEAERIAEALNEESFKVPQVPLRRSVRITKATSRYTDQPTVKDYDNNFLEVSNKCHINHKGLYCADKEVDHFPDYYDSSENCSVCKYETCESLLLSNEIDSVKCCNKGTVDLSKHLANIEKQPDELDQLKNGQNAAKTKNFLANTWRYNTEMAFGTLVMEKESVPHGMPVAKINGAIKYRLSDLHFPQQHSGNADNYKRKWGQCYTIAPDDAIRERTEGLDPNDRLKPEIIADLHRLLDKYHVLAKAYKSCAQFYAEKKQLCDQLGIDMPQFRMTLMNKRKAIKEGANVDSGIHDHRLLLPTEKGLMQCATVHFDQEADNGPPKERGVMLTGKDGRSVDFAPFDPNIDAALFPLLFAYGQRTYELSIPLKKTEEDQQKQSKSVDNQSIMHEEFSDDEEHEEAAIDLIDHPGDEAGDEVNGQIEAEQHEDISDTEDADGEVVDCQEGGAKWKKSEGAHQFVSMRQYYRYMFQMRGNWLNYHWLWWAAMLAQMYILTVYNRIEANEANAIKRAQQNLVTILPAILIKALENKIQTGNFGFGNCAKLGKVFFAPETFRGSRRYYQKAYSDAQAICRAFGNPHILLTFTMNSDAPEFKKLIPKKQTWADRPDIVTRIFINKHKELMKDIVERQIFGPVAAWFSAVEHQKRGLPHLHMCITFKTEDNNYFDEPGWKEKAMKLTPEEWCKKYICAEIPTLPPKRATNKKAQRQREYHDTVVKLMSHHCSPACVVDGKCSKRFPKPFSMSDIVSAETYPVYRRRPFAPSEEEKLANPHLYGESYAFPSSRGTGRIIDNRHIVAHNPYLIKKYKSHINIEWIQGDATAKYVTKYITKGCDLALVKVQKESDNAPAVVNYDEFEEIRLGVYRTSSEAGLGIWGHKIFSKSHHVQTLYVHEPGKINVVFEDGEEEKAAERAMKNEQIGKEQKSQLTEFFKTNARLKLDGKDDQRLKHTYATFCEDYWWSKNCKSWFERKRKLQKLVRIGSAAPGKIELQAIRILLLTVKGPTSFEDLRVDPIDPKKIHPTFVDAAIARRLLIDDFMWNETVKDAMSEKRSLSERIRWFALFIANALPKKPMELLERHFDNLTMWPGNMTKDQKMERLLKRIEITLRIHGIQPNDENETSCQMVGLSAPANFRMTKQDEIEATYFRDDFLAKHMSDTDGDPQSGSTNNYGTKFQQWHSLCTVQEQKPFVDAVMQAAKADPKDNSVQKQFFLTGEGGTGKTFTYNTIIAGMKSMGMRVLPCATTGIAANLLIEGSTVHRRFGVPNDVKHDTPPRIARHSNYAAILDSAQLIIIDEVSMQDRYVLEYLDRQLRSFKPEYADLPFGGKAIIIGGDWKQLMPVLPGKDENHQFARSVKSSVHYKLFKTTRLTINKRLANANSNTKKFARYMKKLATGVTTDQNNRIELPKSLQMENEQNFIDFIFPPSALQDPFKHIDKLKGSAILCPTNKETFRIHEQLLEKMPGKGCTMLSTDQPDRSNPLDCLSVYASDKYEENLNRQTPSGFPPHKLVIKEGAIMMINRNLSVQDGLCNGTRVQIKKIKSAYILICTHLSGPNAGKDFELYRCLFSDGEGDQEQNQSAMRWTRMQFPLRPGFVMTINKAQGQTLDRVGIALNKGECFSHGQLYVAFSRVRDPDYLRVLTRTGATSIQNIVHQAIIDQEEIDEAYKMAEEDMLRERAGSPRFEYRDPSEQSLQMHSQPSLENQTPATSKIPTTSTPTVPTPSTTRRSTRRSVTRRISESEYGGTAGGQQYFGRLSALQGTTRVHESAPDGNCFFHSVAHFTNKKTHAYLRQQAAATLENIDTNGSQELRDRMRDQIMGTLPGGEAEYQNKYQGSITNYARNFTARTKTYVGIPEALALAQHLQREIAIITPQSEAAQQYQQSRLGHYFAVDMVFVCLPNLETRIHQINKDRFEEVWQWERNPIVILHNGHNHYNALEWIEQ